MSNNSNSTTQLTTARTSPIPLISQINSNRNIRILRMLKFKITHTIQSNQHKDNLFIKSPSKRIKNCLKELILISMMIYNGNRSILGTAQRQPKGNKLLLCRQRLLASMTQSQRSTKIRLW
jgi:hypothetical protein